MFPLHSLGIHFLRNKFQWLLAKYTSIEDQNDVKVLPKPSVQKLAIFDHFIDSVQIHAKVVKTNILFYWTFLKNLFKKAVGLKNS